MTWILLWLEITAAGADGTGHERRLGDRHTAWTSSPFSLEERFSELETLSANGQSPAFNALRSAFLVGMARFERNDDQRDGFEIARFDCLRYTRPTGGRSEGHFESGSEYFFARRNVIPFRFYPMESEGRGGLGESIRMLVRNEFPAIRGKGTDSSTPLAIDTDSLNGRILNQRGATALIHVALQAEHDLAWRGFQGGNSHQTLMFQSVRAEGARKLLIRMDRGATLDRNRHQPQGRNDSSTVSYCLVDLPSAE